MEKIKFENDNVKMVYDSIINSDGCIEFVTNVISHYEGELIDCEISINCNDEIEILRSDGMELGIEEIEEILITEWDLRNYQEMQEFFN